MAILCMHNASSHNYRNSSVIVDLAMGQMHLECTSTEHISNCCYFFFFVLFHCLLVPMCLFCVICALDMLLVKATYLLIYF